MSTDDHARPDPWGIHLHWVDAHDTTREVAEPTVRSLRRAIGRPPDDLEESAPIVTRPGRDIGREVGLDACEVTCEDGSTRRVQGVLSEDFPLGYHWLTTAEGRRRRLIVSPGRCWLPAGWRAWGWTIQLYAARSRDSWGIGDLADLRSLREWAADSGAGFLLVNPLHAVAPTFPQEDSPYLPATRRFRNPVYLRVEEIAGFDDPDVARRGRGLNAGLVDRDEVWRLKRSVLWELFRRAGDLDALEQWRAEQGRSLEEFAIWSVLAEEHGPDWRQWPEDLRHPSRDGVRLFAEQRCEQVSFFVWLQWQLDRQLRAACADMPVIQDLPIGVDGGGADAWSWQEIWAGGVTVGAPPDVFNTEGQGWGSPPLTPWRLRAADYEPFIESIRETMAGAGGIRIDHVMGLFRLYWIPQGGSPADGAYVRYPSADLLDIVALESHRAQAIVVGEDLGTVEPGVREDLAEHAIVSYKLLWFEEDDPAQWPESALAAVTTHDLPTIAGLWTGSDAAEQAVLTGAPREELEVNRREMLDRLVRAGVPASADVTEAIASAHRLLGRAPSILVAATLEDAVGEERRPNIPGTTTRENWCIPLPVEIEDLPSHPIASALMAGLRRASDS